MGVYKFGDRVVDPQKYPWGYDATMWGLSHTAGRYISTSEKILSPTGDRTQEFIFRSSNTTAATRSLYADCFIRSTNIGTNVRVHPTNGFGLHIVRGTDGQMPVYGYVYNPGTFFNGAIHHIAYTWDGSADANSMKIYHNGALAVEVSPDYAAAGAVSQYNSVLGVRYSSSGALELYFEGDFFASRVWNVIRTQAQIEKYMHRQLTGKESGLVADWQMNEGAYQWAYDQSDNKYHGKIINPVWVKV